MEKFTGCRNPVFISFEELITQVWSKIRLDHRTNSSLNQVGPGSSVRNGIFLPLLNPHVSHQTQSRAFDTVELYRRLDPLSLKSQNHSSSLTLSAVSISLSILFLSPNSSRITPPMRVLVLQYLKIHTLILAKKTAILTGEASFLLLFRHVSPEPGDSTLQFRLIHFWEARKNVKGGPGIILGIDAEGTVAQGFISQNRRNQYEKQLRRGSIYTLTNFYASNSKVMYHVADQRLVICISHASDLSKVEENIEGILTKRFRIHSFSDFEANCDPRGDLHDVVGHLNLVDGQPLHQRPVLCTKDGSTSRKVLVHLQFKDGPVINVYIWDEAAENFRLKFDACAATPTVLLVTTVNPKRLGGKLCLSSMSSSRVFLDEEVDPTKEYMTWLTTNPSATATVNPVEVVKSETLTISEIAAFIKRQPAKIAYFDCIATIDDVKLGTEWYYIACKDCQTKLNRGPTTMLCLKYGNENATAVAKQDSPFKHVFILKFIY
ncbi:hypothetical protein HID58_087991 [Brassica napus]|uniref:Replication factor A C-terminal domain-containing protein n=1 Tax=Brassica napus TaxID=3708 RepID=A0ABQ7XUT7_BRANA|nr:hypothetical protein HID58_087991 [Brassica napus]